MIPTVRRVMKEETLALDSCKATFATNTNASRGRRPLLRQFLGARLREVRRESPLRSSLGAKRPPMLSVEGRRIFGVWSSRIELLLEMVFKKLSTDEGQTLLYFT